MRVKKVVLIVCVSAIIWVCCSTHEAYSDTFYKWIDEEGNVQYSNQLPSEYSPDDPNVAVIQSTTRLSKAGSFVKKRVLRDSIQMIPEEEWERKFGEIGKQTPELPEDKIEALTKLNKIIADEVIFLDKYKKRYYHYLKSYQERKKAYEKEVSEHKLQIALKIWRPTILLESEEQYDRMKNNFETTIRFRELVLQWAKQKKIELESA